MANGSLNPVMIRGAATTSGLPVSGYAFVDLSGTLAVNASISIPSITTNISGQSVFVMSGSGPLFVNGASGAGATLSGITVIGSFTANVSGQSVALFSGSNNVREVGTNIINSILSGYNIITGNSGGNTLFSGGPFISVLLRNASGNNPIWVGQPSTVTTNIGMPIFANETVTLKVSNFNAVGAFATTSGQLLYYIGLQ